KRFSSESRSCETVFDYAGKQQKVAAIEDRMSAGDLWNNQESAREKVRDAQSLKAILKPLDEVVRAGDDLPGMLELADADDGFAAEVKSEIERLEQLLDELELKSLLSGPHDAAGAIVSINARDGGTDANDWAEML